MVAQIKKINNGQHIEQVSQHIAKAIQGIRYGSVEIIIHEGKVVQLERREKLRFEDQCRPG